MRYGNPASVNTDVKALNDIISRQGNQLLIDVMAEQIGEAVLRYGLSESHVKRIIDSLVTDLKDAILERT